MWGLACLLPAHAADRVVVILGSEAAPYQEALSGFQESYGQAVTVLHSSDGKPNIPAEVRVIVAFGGKAALAGSAEDATLIYGLAPGLKLESRPRSGLRIKIHTAPVMSETLRRLKEIQPGLRRLAVLWSSDSIPDYLEESASTAKAQGIVIVSEKLSRIEDLPDRLRSFKEDVDALWLAPDPLIITPTAFSSAREFSYATDKPLYVPMDGLAEKGAVAAVYCAFREIGRKAGALALRAASGEAVPPISYPDQIVVTLNLTAAKNAGLEIPAPALKQASKVIP